MPSRPLCRLWYHRSRHPDLTPPEIRMSWSMVSKAAERSRRQRHDILCDPIAGCSGHFACLFTVHFASTPLRSWTWLYHKKASLSQNSTIHSAYGNIVKFSHTSRSSISTPCLHCKLYSWILEKRRKPCQRQPLPLRHVDFHLTHECLGPPDSPAKRQLDRYTHFHSTAQQTGWPLSRHYEIPWQCTALMPMSSGTHSMPILLVYVNDQTIKFQNTS